MADVTSSLHSQPESLGSLNNCIKSVTDSDSTEISKTETTEDTPHKEGVKVNGENHLKSFFVPQEDSYSSESDALIIDESLPKRKIKRTKHDKNKILELCEKKSEVNSNVDSVSLNESVNKTVDNKKSLDKSSNDVQMVQNQNNSSNSVENTSVVNDFLPHGSLLEYCEKIPSDFHAENQEPLTHSNPYFNESLFELSQLSQLQSTNQPILTPVSIDPIRPPPRVFKNSLGYTGSNIQFKTLRKIKPKPKNTEYAQYLGLQPAVQFKCSKCGKSGFESLVILQDHLIKCNAIAITGVHNKANFVGNTVISTEKSLEKSSTEKEKAATDKEKCSKFKLTRKVFLCSACGTYYENWNLYMHMLEFHKRYVCLYCLGMFSILDDLFNHIQTKHNVEPGVKGTLEDFYKVYDEPCYVVCCECSKLFSEKDNFFNHRCVPLSKTTKNKHKFIRGPIRPEQHVTGEGTLNDITSEKIDDVEKKGVNEDTCDNESTKLKTKIQKSDAKVVETQNQQKENQLITESDEENNHDKKENTSDRQRHNSNNSDISQSLSEKCLEKNKNMSKDVDVKTPNENDVLIQDSKESNESNDKIEYEKDAPLDEKLDSPVDTREDNMEDLLEPMETDEPPPIETRKVPKLSLKIPKLGTYSEPEAEDSDYSDKLDTHEDQDHLESENENEGVEKLTEEDKSLVPDVPEASLDVPTVELTELEQPLDKIDIRVLLQKCLKTTAGTCIYCNHSRRIAINGKQLGLHAIAQHRYCAVVKSITAEELHPENFVARIKESLDELENMYFNLESGLSNEAVTYSHVYECFQCYYTTNVHKELYLHNRKFHSKNLLLCIMCKSNFYSYSELICHLCPGAYVSEIDLEFRCCMCVSEDLPSSFRLMVHLRKRHNVCDVCLDMCHTQFKLSNHVWKHKLNHFCYRCGIAYRNKPDITRHLFWKHGTESILCKKCLQKKWPHMYHFCQPPAQFTCDECNLTFSKAVYLKVHKRIHTNEKKHPCTFEGCEEMYISKKLMIKHERNHWEPPEEIKPAPEESKEDVHQKVEEVTEQNVFTPKVEEIIEESPKPKVDPINSLPELNLSESDSSDSETEETEETKIKNDGSEEPNYQSKDEIQPQNKIEKSEPSESKPESVIEETAQVMDNIWNNFKNYQASKDKLFAQDSMDKLETNVSDIPIPMVEEDHDLSWEKALLDHDYCLPPKKDEVVKDTSIIEVKPALDQIDRADHDYCFSKEEEKEEYKTIAEEDEKLIFPEKPPLTLLGGVAATAIEPVLEYDDTKPTKEESSSSSSSDSDSSSCSCGSNCSCSSSSGSNSSTDESSNSDSSTEEGRKKQQLRRQKRAKQKEKSKNKLKKSQGSPVKHEKKIDIVASDQPAVYVEPPIAESDLETTESDTDEEFYDKRPQLFAKKLMEEKRAMILAQMGSDIFANGSFFESASRPPTPPAGTMEEEMRPTKKKKKNKKRKKRKAEKHRESLENRTYSATLIMPEENSVPKAGTPPFYRSQDSPTVAPITLSLSRNSPLITPNTPPVTMMSKDIYLSKPELPNFSRQDSDASLRASKRRRVPNKFYGYSSDEEERSGGGPSVPKTRRVETSPVTSPVSPKLVPPITIKTVPSPLAVPPKQPTVEPITLKLPKFTKSKTKNPHSNNNSSRGHKIKKPIPPIRLPTYLANRIPPRPPLPSPPPMPSHNDSDSNDSEPEQQQSHNYLLPPEPPRDVQPQLYCYCRCPYDEVSEMIGCDSNECEIEWFHFECVGIMVPPKGQWFCPDCRKKKQRRELLQAQQAYSQHQF